MLNSLLDITSMSVCRSNFVVVLLMRLRLRNEEGAQYAFWRVGRCWEWKRTKVGPPEMLRMAFGEIL